MRDRAGATNSLQSYYIVETKAPAGYNLLSSPVTVTFTGSEVGYTYLLQVMNHQGFVLPVTGGAGTMAFVIIGIILIGAGGLVLVVTRKKRQDY